MFITLFLAIIDTQSNLITYARAGHEPSLLGKRDEVGNFEVSKLHGGGMALGMVPPELFEEMIEDCESSFERNDMLVLYTDGVTEAANHEKEEFGTNRLSELLATSSKSSAKDFNRMLVNKLDEFSSTESERDDITLLTVKRV